MGDAPRSPVAELVALGPVPGAAQQDTDPHAERRESLGEELRRAGAAYGSARVVSAARDDLETR